MEKVGSHLTIQSNAALQYFPNNKPDSFKVKLARRMIYDARTVVGMRVIHYSLNCVNVVNNNNTPMVMVVDEEEPEIVSLTESDALTSLSPIPPPPEPKRVKREPKRSVDA